MIQGQVQFQRVHPNLKPEHIELQGHSSKDRKSDSQQRPTSLDTFLKYARVCTPQRQTRLQDDQTNVAKCV
jgi:hypothetical protein